MPHDLDNTKAVLLKKDGTPRKGKGGRRRGQRTARDLNNTQIKALKADARVAENLWIQVTERGSKSWVMEKMWKGERFWLGLGSYPEVSLKQAEAKVAEYNAKLAKGEDPRKPISPHPFIEVMEPWLVKKRPSWSSAKYAKDVESEPHRYCDAIIGDMDVAVIDTPDIFNVLTQPTERDQPLWIDKHPLAFRLKGHIQSVIGYARAMKWRKGDNPAVWEDNLGFLLAAPKDVHKPEPYPSLHHTEIAAFMVALRWMDDWLAYRCLEALILTGLRTSEALGARWPEIDLQRGLWKVPGSRMKKRRDHTAVLSQQAVALFQSLPHTGDLVFGTLDDDALRDALAAVMERAGRQWFDQQSKLLVVPHGFRASFGTWAGSQGYENELIDIALAHATANATLRRYQRDDKAELRREMMQAWADHLDG